ncbi:uncharacterized protein LOC128985857 [Macrosteles quadrilineatus]|uniref:uncharacterized protein LOC128985857 n=1 Tax=Macrosteles quadrilineatus TaxID=74068 RepID=UPI0023E24A54|nr:uncharacterized protein LOC128985857 [Macrosteles quadrilineatus]
MERPERPSRHKSNPNRFPIRPSFSSDSESETNDNEVPIQITFTNIYQSESTNGNAGPSTSSGSQSGPAGNVAPTENSIGSLRATPPVTPLRVTLSPISRPSPEGEGPSTQSTQDVVRRKRSATSSAASVIFDSVDTLISSNSSMSVQITDNRSSTSPERFPPGEYLIRPKSFCNMRDIWQTNAIRPSSSSYKLKRFNIPNDSNPTISNRDSAAAPPPPVVSSSFSLQDAVLPNTPETTHSSFYSSRTNAPQYIPTRNSQSSTNSSSILRQFDEMCSTGTTPPRRRKYVRFLEVPRYSDGPANETASLIQPSSLPSSSISASVRNTPSLDDYCDLVGNFLFNYPSSSQSSENPRSPPVTVPLERSSLLDQQSSSTADIIDRHAHSIISEINSYLDPVEPGEPMEQSNDDVIVVETPERPALPDSPDIVPSSRSPSPSPLPLPTRASPLQPTSAAIPPAPRVDKPQSSGSSEVPMTLPELNQSLVALLECPVCLDHATPPIYQCMKGHILCQNCHPRLTLCPMCRSRLPGDRNSVMEKVAEKLMYPCKNTVTGCTMMLKLNDKQAHEDGCGFRHYACIVDACSWKGYKPELVVHLQSSHPDKLITGATQELLVPISGIIGGSGFVVHDWIQSAHNEVFHVVFNVDTFKRIMKGCVVYVGSREKADKFEYLFQLKQRVSPFRKLSYSRTTHVDTLKQGQPLCLRDDFSINIDMAQLYRPSDCCHQIIPIFITITQLE